MLRIIHLVNIETCSECGGAVKVIACIEDPTVMPKALAALAGQAFQKILDHLKGKAEPNETAPLPESRAPPLSLFA
jgi:hypothetical protein